jgi:hypothetical protein
LRFRTAGGTFERRHVPKNESRGNLHGDDGTPAMWLMNGMSIVSQGVIGANPGADWHIVG